MWYRVLFQGIAVLFIVILGAVVAKN
jgi:hypothetical protein